MDNLKQIYYLILHWYWFVEIIDISFVSLTSNEGCARGASSIDESTYPLTSNIETYLT